MLVRFLLPCLLFLAACSAPELTEVPERRAPTGTDLPPMKTFAQPRITAPQRANADIARDFLDLSFRMESGRVLERMTRFEQPISVAVAPGAPASLRPDLAALLRRLQREAGIDIRIQGAADSGRANVMIEALPRRTLQAVVPQAACFVAPNVSSWAEYRRQRRSSNVDWTALPLREHVAIFLPADVSPQEIRDCLHEELAQAIGPLNDLYRLPDSVFNDDNFHTVLTGFDMLILRLYYAPELANGMSRDQVAARLPGLLARLNPSGQGRPAASPVATPRAWVRSIEAALGPGTPDPRRVDAAAQALSIARSAGIADHRLAFSQFALGRVTLSLGSRAAIDHFAAAERLYARNPLTRVQHAHVAMHLAAFALSEGRAEDALRMINADLTPVAASENAALLATMMMIKAEALDLLGRSAEAQAVRLDSLGWARYGFGSDAEVRARLFEIVSLSPRSSRI